MDRRTFLAGICAVPLAGQLTGRCCDAVPETITCRLTSTPIAVTREWITLQYQDGEWHQIANAEYRTRAPS